MEHCGLLQPLYRECENLRKLRSLASTVIFVKLLITCVVPAGSCACELWCVHGSPGANPGWQGKTWKLNSRIWHAS